MIIQPIKYDPKPPAHIFGVYWDGSQSSSMLRTDDSALFADPVPYVSGASSYSSPFDDYLPWSGMGIVDDSDAGKIVSIPKFWYKWTRDSEVTGDMKLQIADYAADGFLVSPAHADRGDGSGERDVVYVGRYHCSTSDYKSTTGVLPKADITRATARSAISNLGAKIWQWDYAMVWTIRMLYLVEFASWDSQSKIGYGCGNGFSKEKTGASDSMLYHTGTAQASRTTYGVGCQYRHIEDLWGNVWTFCDGIYATSSSVYIIKNPSYFSDSSNGTYINGTLIASNGSACIKTWTNPSVTGLEYAIFPSSVESNSDFATYVCDRYFRDANDQSVVFCGGKFSRSKECGLFALLNNLKAIDHYGDIGCRLMKLP